MIEYEKEGMKNLLTDSKHILFTNERYKYIPLDFCCFEVRGKYSDEYKNALMINPCFNFRTNVNESTGETNYSYMKYQGMLLRIHNSGRITLQGSLHMLKNNYKHNHDQFTKEDFKEALDLLKILFHVEPYELFITKLEYGLNITGLKSHNTVTQILNGLILHKNYMFSKENQKYRHTCFLEHAKYTIKIYDKGRQYLLKDPILRIEVRQDNWEHKLKYDFGIKTLQDYIDSDKTYFVNSLLQKWNEIIFFDYSIPELRDTIYNKKSYWSSQYFRLTRMQKKRARDRLNSLTKSNKGNMKDIVKNKITETINALNGRVKTSYLNRDMLRLST